MQTLVTFNIYSCLSYRLRMSGLVSRLRNGIPRPHLHAAGTEEVKGQDKWLDNDDIRYVVQNESIELFTNQRADHSNSPIEHGI